MSLNNLAETDQENSSTKMSHSYAYICIITKVSYENVTSPGFDFQVPRPKMGKSYPLDNLTVGTILIGLKRREKYRLKKFEKQVKQATSNIGRIFWFYQFYLPGDFPYL